MAHEISSVFSKDPVTDHVLRVYHEIGASDSFKQWRESIPADARRIWLQDMLERVMQQKMTRGPLYESVKDLFPSALQERLASLRRQIQAKELEQEEIIRLVRGERGSRKEWTTVADDEQEERFDHALERLDGIEERLAGLDGLYHATINLFLEKDEGKKVLQRFAERYFTEFETDEKSLREFKERQAREVKQLIQGLRGFLDWIQGEGWEVLRGSRDFGTLRQWISPEKKNPKERWSSGVDGAVVFGSAAIGPRRTDIYKKRQDTDILFLFRPGGKSTPTLLEVMEIFHQGLVQDDSEGPLSRVLERCLPMQELRAAFPPALHLIDAFPIILPRSPVSFKRNETILEGRSPWWIHLCGPHRYLPTEDGSLHSRETYDHICRQAIRLTRQQEKK